jgi:hypothetical protein
LTSLFAIPISKTWRILNANLCWTSHSLFSFNDRENNNSNNCHFVASHYPAHSLAMIQNSCDTSVSVSMYPLGYIDLNSFLHFAPGTSNLVRGSMSVWWAAFTLMLFVNCAKSVSFLTVFAVILWTADSVSGWIVEWVYRIPFINY